MRILKEKHNWYCQCSYCKSLFNNGFGSFGFWSPIDKKWNSWRVLWFMKSKYNYYIRWTLKSPN